MSPSYFILCFWDGQNLLLFSFFFFFFFFIFLEIIEHLLKLTPSLSLPSKLGVGCFGSASRGLVYKVLWGGGGGGGGRARKTVEDFWVKTQESQEVQTIQLDKCRG